MPPQPSSPGGKIIPLLLLSIGYLSILPFGAAAIDRSMPHNTCVVLPHTVIELLPLLGLGLMVGYRQATLGRQPWNAPKLFWITSFLFNAGLFLLVVPPSFLGEMSDTLWFPVRDVRDAINPRYDPQALLTAVAGFFVYFFVFAMPVVAALSAREFVRVSRKTKTSLPENRIPPWSQPSA